jgi:Polyketide cyclase / dehydrase and lipid transport
MIWTHNESIEAVAVPEQIWKLFCDVNGWKKWNPGIEHIEIHGPFEVGTRFTMRPPGSDAFVSTLTSVNENESFTDETVIEDTRVEVNHRIQPLQDGRCRIIYSTTITGRAAAEIGPFVTGDFSSVLLSLKRLSESQIGN